MAWVITDMNCPECGAEHVLCLLDPETYDSNNNYEYKCPSTHQMVTFFGDWAHEVPNCPADFIVINEA